MRARLRLPAVFEVPGTTPMRATDENEEPTDELVSLEDEYVDGMLPIASRRITDSKYLLYHRQHHFAAG
jgi:hypothetical protein